jgi:hypothetical protein
VLSLLVLSADVLGLGLGLLFEGSHLFIRTKDQPFVDLLDTLLLKSAPGFAKLPDAHW